MIGRLRLMNFFQFKRLFTMEGNYQTVGIVIDSNVEDAEVIFPRLRFKEDGMKVLLIGPRNEKIQGKHGYPFTVDTTLNDITPDDLDCLVIPGGYAPDLMRTDKRVLELTRSMVGSGKPVGAVCHGAWVLVSAKVLPGHQATCFSAIKDDVENAGATYIDQSVVVSDNIVTSRFPDDLPDFCRELRHLLSNKK